MTLKHSSVVKSTTLTYQQEISSIDHGQSSTEIDIDFDILDKEELHNKIALANTISRLSSSAYSQLRNQKVDTVFRNTELTLQAQADSYYWAPEATATRIVETSIAISSGNTDKINIIIDAVEKGFTDAQVTFGGTLPEISRKTREAVFSQLDNWAKVTRLSNNASA